MAMIKVTIPEERFIPTLGKGPFRKPIMISEETYRMLRRMNYIVNLVNGQEKQKTPEDTQEEVVEAEVETPVEETVEETTEDEILEEETTTEENEVEESLEEGESGEDETPEEDPVEDPVEEVQDEDELELTEEDETFLRNAKKTEIQDFFTDLGIEFNESDTISQLLAIVGIEK